MEFGPRVCDVADQQFHQSVENRIGPSSPMLPQTGRQFVAVRSDKTRPRYPAEVNHLGNFGPRHLNDDGREYLQSYRQCDIITARPHYSQ